MSLKFFIIFPIITTVVQHTVLRTKVWPAMATWYIALHGLKFFFQFHIKGMLKFALHFCKYMTKIKIKSIHKNICNNHRFTGSVSFMKINMERYTTLPLIMQSSFFSPSLWLISIKLPHFLIQDHLILSPFTVQCSITSQLILDNVVKWRPLTSTSKCTRQVTIFVAALNGLSYIPPANVNTCLTL